MINANHFGTKLLWSTDMRWLAMNNVFEVNAMRKIETSIDFGHDTRRMEMCGFFLAIVCCNPTTTTVKLSNWNFNQSIRPVQLHAHRTAAHAYFVFTVGPYNLFPWSFLTAWRISLVHMRKLHEMNYYYYHYMIRGYMMWGSLSHSYEICWQQRSLAGWSTLLAQNTRLSRSNTEMCSISLGRSHMML